MPPCSIDQMRKFHLKTFFQKEAPSSFSFSREPIWHKMLYVEDFLQSSIWHNFCHVFLLTETTEEMGMIIYELIQYSAQDSGTFILSAIEKECPALEKLAGDRLLLSGDIPANLKLEAMPGIKIKRDGNDHAFITIPPKENCAIRFRVPRGEWKYIVVRRILLRQWWLNRDRCIGYVLEMYSEEDLSLCRKAILAPPPKRRYSPLTF